MFTGLIEEVGTLTENRPLSSQARKITVQAHFSSELKLGDSVSLNGVCQTVVQKDSRTFTVEALGATLAKTTLGRLKSGGPVNLERALRADGRLDGHLVQGHVSATGTLLGRDRKGEACFLTVRVPEALWPQLVDEGSVAIDGVSLTVADAGRGTGLIRLSLIPHTLSHTNLGSLALGSEVNIETDFLLRFAAQNTQSQLTLEKLSSWGYQ